MKNTLFSVVLFLLLFSCQKEEVVNPTVELFKGVWKPTASKSEFFDAANVKVHENVITPLDGTVTITDKNIYFNYKDSTPSTTTYQIKEKDGKKYLYVTPSEGGTPIEFEITTLTEYNMTWLIETPNLVYNDYENGVEKQAAKHLVRVEYQKQ